ncbi:LysR substrate-binding domain-containing protein [Paremcibacter congregatus]|uniref:DNA-binding transcriptional regulator OxyR n=1 Tax=Paremcibacter congregatus TaxID=2043170 RepID=A0A2G4YRB4_9PROT|nr:LysR substrate-binding domain-containing protein [Paremcibacter congregatus]PHZ83996.1 DNA-binding transcriptional regulator OxyR [Paremcibacter congregatus]QDE25910.1 LysR family transcriptional regulator [Paremcibacter congregatus]
MNIRDLQYFLAVADLGHFGQAAEQCCVSQPTLSGQIKKLEEQLGVLLLERTNRRVMLSEVGQQVAQAARHILREVDRINEIAESAHDPLAGKFRLGAFPTLSTYTFPDLVPKIKEILPNLRLILIEEKTATLIDKLHKGEIDAAFLALPLQDNFLVSEKLYEDEFLLAVPPDHELTQFKTIDQNTLKSYRLLLLEEGHCLRDQALDVCSVHGIGEEMDFKATGLETLRQMVKAGTGITFMPKIAINEDETGICYIPFTQPAPKRSIGLVWRKTTAKKAVIDKIIREFQKD